MPILSTHQFRTSSLNSWLGWKRRNDDSARKAERAGKMSGANFKDDLVAEIPGLRAFAISLSGSVTLADDLVQEALLRAWSNSDKFQLGTSMRAWLFTILRNAYYSHYRKQSREVQDTDGVYSGRLAASGDQESHLDLS